MQRVMRMSASDLLKERVDSAEEDVHFSEVLVEAVVAEFSKPGDVVLDPFAGYGTTLVVSERMNRSAVGIELLPDRVTTIRQRLGGSARIIEGDARNLAGMDLGQIDLCLTSPPYMSAADHPDNPLTGYRTLDGDYPTYLAELAEVFAAVARILRPGGHLVINAANIRNGELVTPLAWDLTRAVAQHLGLRAETYLEWDDPPEWMSGDYCLVFQKELPG
ncbi:MAG: DNA methyltransferase [Pseudonocardiales bacterium]